MVSFQELGDVLPFAAHAAANGETAAIVTVLADRTGQFASPACRLFVPENGPVQGAIHQCLDETLIQQARVAMQRRRSQVRSYRVSSDDVQDLGIQGGDLDIFFEVLERPLRLVIVGGGHIAVPLARIGKLLDYQVIVLDDRPEYANRERFPDADQILVGPYRQTIAGLPIHSDTYIVLVTRGHFHDQACLEEVLDSPAPYIGMIGSKRRVRTVLRHLRELGRDATRLHRVRAPVGLDIEARTPAEIALSVAAEIVNVQRGGRAPSMGLREKPRA